MSSAADGGKEGEEEGAGGTDRGGASRGRNRRSIGKWERKREGASDGCGIDRFPTKF
jgi:hypothetical protein